MKLDLGDLKKRFQTRAALAITLESGRTAVAVVRRGPDVSGHHQEFVLPIGADAVLADPAKAGQQLSEALEMARIKERRCVVSVPPGWAMTASSEVRPKSSSRQFRCGGSACAAGEAWGWAQPSLTSFTCWSTDELISKSAPGAPAWHSAMAER